MDRRRRWTAPLLAALLPVALILGAWYGSDPGRLPGGLRDAFGVDRQDVVFDDVMDRIAGQYYRRVDRDELLDKSLQGAVESLDDPFSSYFGPKAYARFQELTAGQFQGVGLNVQGESRGLRIMSVFRDTPASRAGLRAGDLIVAVGDTTLRGRSADQATALIKGPAGTEV